MALQRVAPESRYVDYALRWASSHNRDLGCGAGDFRHAGASFVRRSAVKAGHGSTGREPRVFFRPGAFGTDAIIGATACLFFGGRGRKLDGDLPSWALGG